MQKYPKIEIFGYFWKFQKQVFKILQKSRKIGILDFFPKFLGSEKIRRPKNFSRFSENRKIRENLKIPEFSKKSRFFLYQILTK